MDASALPGYSATAPHALAHAPARTPGLAPDPAPAHALRQGGRQALRAALLGERARTLRLARAFEAALGPAMQVPQAAGLNPPRWELGHIAWFEQWWIARNPQRHLGAQADPDVPRPPPDLPGADELYHSSRVPHEARWGLPLPSLPATLDWMGSVQAHTLQALDALPPDASDADLYFFRLACAHEAMHAEAACYMARALGFEAQPLAPAPLALAPARLQMPAGPWRLGSAGPGFAFDNELQGQRVELPSHDIDNQPVSWDLWQAFVRDGGYAQPRWWTDVGWAWRQCARAPQPQFPEGPGAACHLSLHEAQAWCRWAGRQLPTEAQWERAALTHPGFSWGQVWEWTASPFQPFPGFRPHPYRDYSQPWFGSRAVLRGASPATSACMAHPRYRNFFEPHRHDILAGFRSCA